MPAARRAGTGAGDSLHTGEGLVIITPFLPAPLIERLGGEGVASKVERGRGNDWIVYFWRNQN